jgi:hypothetical protein
VLRQQRLHGADVEVRPQCGKIKKNGFHMAMRCVVVQSIGR